MEKNKNLALAAYQDNFLTSGLIFFSHSVRIVFSRWPSSSNVPLVNINTLLKNRQKIIEERKFLTRFEKMNPRLVIQVKKIVSKLSVGGRWLIG